MNYLFYLGHPAHFHLFLPVIKALQSKNHKIKILIKKKDILEELLNESKLEHINILPKGRKDDFFSILFAQLKRDYQLFKLLNGRKPDLMIGTSAEIAHIGKIKSIPSIVVNEDDYNVVPLFSYSSYPFASTIFTPLSCSVGRWKGKNVAYNGYHELAYLHPKLFIPDNKIVCHLLENVKRFFILRFSNLNAHHDKGKKGIDDGLAKRIITKLENYGKVYITSERELSKDFEKYRIILNPLHIHHALHFADIFIGDSQTMTAEAAVLGTPSIRFNDFVGKLGYLEELEHKYGLTYGIKTSEPEKLFQKIDELLAMPNLKEEWQKRRQKMLSDKIDVTAFMVWFIENYPESVKVMQDNPDYQYRFK